MNCRKMRDSQVPSFLRESSKGKLKYDRFWVEEGRTEKILQIGNELTKLYHMSPRRKFQYAETPISETQLQQADKEKDERDETEKVEVLQDRDGDEYDLPTAASPVQMCLIAYEDERNKNVLENLKMKRDRVEQHTQLNHQWAEQQMEHMKQKIHLDMQKRVNDMILERDKEQQEVKERQQIQREHIKSKARRLSVRKKEAEARLQQFEELQQQRKREQLELRSRLMEIHNDFNSSVNQIMECLQSNGENQWLNVQPTDRRQNLKDVCDRMNGIFLKCNDSELDPETVQETQNILRNVQTCLKDIQDDIAQANAKQQEEMRVKREKEEKMKVKVDVPVTVNVPLETGAQSQNQQKDEKDSKDSSLLYQSISPSSLQEYAHVIEHQKTWEKSYKPFLDDITLKKYQFDLKKAVNIPVNAISSVSGMHLRDKVDRLSMLLSGKTVAVGNKRVCCTSHPALAFCMDLVAKKLITQAENQVPSNHEAAFPLAAVTVTLFIGFPELKPLFLAHLYLRCPYLVPYYIPQSEGQSQEEYYKALGYLYVAGTVEEQDKFLKRMSGIVRFYGAILHTSPIPGSDSPHPHGLAFGWKLLSKILNLRPRANITTSVLYDFLDVTGNALYCAYGKQFRKVLHILCKDYFQEIEKVTPGGSGGPLSRLQAFLQNTIRSGKISPPDGILSKEFWDMR